MEPLSLILFTYSLQVFVEDYGKAFHTDCATYPWVLGSTILCHLLATAWEAIFYNFINSQILLGKIYSFKIHSVPDILLWCLNIDFMPYKPGRYLLGYLNLYFDRFPCLRLLPIGQVFLFFLNFHLGILMSLINLFSLFCCSNYNKNNNTNTKNINNSNI